MYVVLKWDSISIHLQWHADMEDDPLRGGSVVRIFVKNLEPIFNDLLKRGTITPDKLQSNTTWHTNEFSFYDLNENAIVIAEEAKT